MPTAEESRVTLNSSSREKECTSPSIEAKIIEGSIFAAVANRDKDNEKNIQNDAFLEKALKIKERITESMRNCTITQKVSSSQVIFGDTISRLRIGKTASLKDGSNLNPQRLKSLTSNRLHKGPDLLSLENPQVHHFAR